MPRKNTQTNKANESNTKKFKKITLMVPCYNEEASIASVIEGIPLKKLNHAGFKIEVLVIDNNSTDKTAEIARSKGARVISEPNQGKGNAIRTGFKSIPKDVDYVVMVDGDDTYKTTEIFFTLYAFLRSLASLLEWHTYPLRFLNNSLDINFM